MALPLMGWASGIVEVWFSDAKYVDNGLARASSDAGPL